ncbi:ankyrin repeat domain-containing protein 26 isoform X4 [Crotalus tigris]|uniref:ankyrin repeat domain-containing protein 26 isoform X4 n=1 Tax=Crotalus tigris TaxID=88082 RepID=UPI00192F9BB8|nr:ankyrin repeat domain-containing protein 26 isoform X4 [Crotalus tigris]
MKKVKKFLGLGRKKNEQQSPSRSRVVACASAPGALICSGCDGYDLQSKDLSKLHRAAAEGDLGELQHLLQKHDLNEQDKGGRTPLHFASANGYIDIVTFLVENKCQLDICDKEKRTPLIKAVECQQEFCAIYLLEHGADPNVKDIDNNTALHFAACNSNVSLAKCLLEKKADIEAQNKDGCTPLIVAVAENNREMVEFLLQQKASVHATDKLGRIPLLIAVPNKNRDLTHILLFHGSNVAHRDKSGWSAKEYAMINDDSILKQYVAKYSDYKNRQEGSFDGQKVLSILRNPEKDGDTGITLGAPAKNKEGFVLNRKIDREVQELLNKSGRDSRKGVTVATVIDNHSSGDSVSSEKADDDSWLSSEEELGCSPKKPEKPSLAQLMKVPWDFLKNYEKDCTIQTELLGGSQQNKADYEFEECNESLPKPLFQVKTFPHSVHSSPGSFSKCSQRTLHSKQEKSSKDEEGDEQNTANKKSIVCRQSWNLSPKAKSTLGMDKDEEEKCTESPWDSECTSESPRKLTISSLPTSPAKIGIHMHSIIEEPFNGKPGFQQKITKENLVCESPAPVLKKAIIEKQKSDLMEELGLDEADDIEDTSDWDSTSISLKSTPCVKPSDMLMLEDHVSPQHLIETNIAPEISVPVKEDSDTQNIISSKGQQYIEHKIVKEFKSKGKEKCLLNTSSSVEKSTHEKHTDKTEIEYTGTHDENVTKALMHSEEAHNDCNHFDSIHWEEKYEKMWVANEKKELKANFKSITAELKQMFGEIKVYEKTSITPSKATSQDGFCCAVEGVKETSLHLQNMKVDIQGKGDIKDVRSVVTERELNTDDWNTNRNPLFNNAKGTKVNISEEKNNNTITQLQANETKAAEKCLEYSLQSHEDITKDTVFKTIDVNQPIASNNLFKHISVTKNPSEETEYRFNNSINSCKGTDIEIGNKAKNHKQVCPQISQKGLDEELEGDVARFKNQVGILHSAFLALEKEKIQLQKEIEEEKIKKELESKGKKIANAEKLAVNNDEKIEQKHSINEIQHITADSISPADKKEVICLGSSSLKATRKSENKRRNSKQKVSQQLCNNLHQPQDESSLSEASLEERYPAKSVNGKNKLYRTLSITNDLDDLTPSSDSAAEDIESLSSIYKEAIVLIEELSLDCKDSVSLLKVQNIFHGYERLIEHEKGRYTQLLEKVKKFENQRNEWQKNLEDLREMKSILDHQKVQYESEITNLKFCLKQEEETRKGAVMLHEKNQEQLRKKDEQYCTQMEEKQQLELMLRSKEMELKTLTNHLKQVEEERNETQRQLCQEQNARAIQEDILNTHFWRQKELEEESKKVASKHSEMIDNHDHEKELLHRNQILQDELGALKLELDRIRIQHQEDESKYLEENESLKEKNEELKKELKLNEDALTQTVFQYNGQINVSKTEVAMVASKLEHMKENKERLEIELDSLRCRLSSALQEVDRCQVSKSDLERLLQREKDEWLRLKDKLNHDVCTLRETNSSLSQQLGKAESKANSLENELHHANHSLREKNLLLDSIQKDVNQSQCQVKELENAQQIAKDQINKFVIKQESMQERLAQVQSENLLLRQQLEDFQNKGIIKEKVVTDVQDKFSDIFNKLRADTEKQVQMMEERNKELITKCNNLKDQVIKYESEKIDRESIIRQLQQELADSLKKQSMTEASLEVSTRYRIDLEEDKQQLLKEVERMKCKLQDSEVQTIQCERSTHELRHALDIKEREASAASQKLQDFLVASSGTNNAIKQLEEHIQRLEIENARLEATTNQQSNRIEILQKDLQDSVSVHNRLEELITSLQAAKINLEEQLNHQVQKENMLSVTAQGAQNMWEEELKLKSKLGIRLSELDKEKTEIISQFENEKKKVKKVLELKRSVELRLDQEMKRNSELQKEYHGMKKLLKITKKKLKGYESGESSSQISLHGEIKNKYSEIDNEVGKLRKRVDELSHHLEIESTRCTQLESTNCELSEQLASMKTLHKNHEKLEKSKLQLEEEVANLKRQVQDNLINLSQVEQYKTEIEERARKDIRQKLEEVNFFLQTQAASQETLEQIRATNNASLRNQLENRIKELETELAKLKNSQQDSILQKESTHTELEKYKGLYSEELKIRKSLGSKLDRANAKLAEASTQLYHERHKNKSLLANSFLSGSLSSSPVLETVHMGNLGNNLALNKSLNLGGGFLNTNGTALASKNRMEAYLAKMQMELEKSIIKELDQAKAEFDAGSVRVSPVGSVDGSSKKSNIDQDQVSKARQQYLDVLKKNYMI